LFWLDWAIIALIAFLGWVMTRPAPRRRRGRLFEFHRQGGRKGSWEVHNQPDPAAAPHKTRARRYSEGDAINNDLTGVKTCRHLLDALDDEWRRLSHTAGQFCLAMVDLDGFKQVNDRMGRPEGDKVLRVVAALLDVETKQPSFVARWGGDEFAVLMPDTETLEAMVRSERLRAKLEADGILAAHEVTASIGIAAFPDHGRTPEEILRAADSGTSVAKRCGGNCVKVGSLSHTPEEQERDRHLLDAYLEAAEERACAPGKSALGSYRECFNQLQPLWDTITALAFAVETRGPYRMDHARAVSRLAAQMARQAGLTPKEIEEIRLAGLVHDIGKIRVPEYVLKKPTLLTVQEFEIVKSHAAWGAKMVEPLSVKAVELIILHHHERYDGKGYPAELAGDRIPLGARMVTVAESFHSMIADLRYKSSRTFADALAELHRCAGTQFDPAVVTTFLDWIQHQG
jgi:diguanylate cyclase (GGDEF)-like protein/putative nucleotidyltransferase with HDIG domain